MNQQLLSLKLGLKLADHTRLEDYVGDAADRLVELGSVVYLYGPSGTGKSHLLEGLCHRAASRQKDALYLPLHGELDPGVLEGLEALQLVCLDNIDSIVTDTAWQAALFHLVNAVRDQGGKLVMSSNQPVSGLSLTLADLESRLKGAYLVRTDELTDAQKLEVIRRKAERRGFAMSEEVCRFILSRSQRDMHHLAHLVAQLDEETLRQQKRVTIPFVKAALGL